MPDEMTTGEIARALARIETNMGDLRREIGERLDRTVSSDLYASQHKAVVDEIAELKADVEEIRKEGRATEQQRVVDRRWWLTAVLIPIAGLVMTYLAPLFGGGGMT